jgi:hypothetical protein
MKSGGDQEVRRRAGRSKMVDVKTKGDRERGDKKRITSEVTRLRSGDTPHDHLLGAQYTQLVYTSASNFAFVIKALLVSVLAQNAELSRFGSFLDEYTSALDQRLDDDGVSTVGDGGDGESSSLPFSTSSFASPFRLLYAPPREQLPVADIVDDDNKYMSKVLLALSSVCLEMDALCSEARSDFFDVLLFYGEAESASGATSEGDAQLALSAVLPSLQESHLPTAFLYFARQRNIFAKSIDLALLCPKHNCLVNSAVHDTARLVVLSRPLRRRPVQLARAAERPPPRQRPRPRQKPCRRRNGGRKHQADARWNVKGRTEGNLRFIFSDCPNL